ncbi:MAG: hypothetical protein HIU81_06100 [Acidobacteria bacterium]|nr:hypothetical protein [Acidobacteriota bacterium]
MQPSSTNTRVLKQPVALAEPPDGAGEDGSAVIEFVFLAVLLMIPVVYLILTLSSLQAGAFAAAGAADQAAKVYAAARSPEAGQAAADTALSVAMLDLGWAADAASVEIQCSQGDCHSAGSTITATVVLRVPLPLVPGLPGVNTSPATVTGQSSAVLGRFR